MSTIATEVIVIVRDTTVKIGVVDMMAAVAQPVMKAVWKCYDRLTFIVFLDNGLITHL
jgi:hypothetical protein